MNKEIMTWREKFERWGEGEFAHEDFEAARFSFRREFEEHEEIKEKILDLPFSQCCKNYVVKFVNYFSDNCNLKNNCDLAQDHYEKRGAKIILDFMFECSGRDREYCRSYYRSIVNRLERNKKDMKKGGRPTIVKLDKREVEYVKRGR